jgi:hypothetical protein
MLFQNIVVGVIILIAIVYLVKRLKRGCCCGCGGKRGLEIKKNSCGCSPDERQ